ncbi:arginine deiminase [Lancefieldella rimae]|uniref:arginine deiminase n=1 Tax=Lancefieldella rimae TaxID=1383 RepID=UPI003A8DE487
MKGISVRSEVAPLKKVLLHRPGRELLNLTPASMERLLFDDIPFLKVAQEEHDALAQLLRDNGVEVVYLEDLMTDVLRLHPELKEQFLMQWLEEGGIHTEKWQQKLLSYLTENFEGKELILKTMEGINLKECYDVERNHSLVDMASFEQKLIVDPMPNLYFTRDPFGSIGSGISLNKMRFPTRNRETIYADYIFKYHPDYTGTPLYTKRTAFFNIEGGDILNLNDKVLAVGVSQRTSPEALEALSINLFADPDCTIRTVLAFAIPSSRAFMHLDTVFTAIDYNKYTVHPEIVGPLQVFEITPGTNGHRLNVREVDATLHDVLCKYTEVDDVDLITCGGDDMIAAQREQWNDGSNTLAIAPGTVVVYERNDVTNRILQEHDVHVLSIPSAELSRGRGGPRCMSMPLVRAE